MPFNIETCRRRAAECERLAARVRDPIARRTYQRAASRWRGMADDGDDGLARLIRLLAPRPLAED